MPVPLALPLVSVGSHLLAAQMVQQMADEMVPQLPEGRKIGIGFGLDTQGAKIAAVFQQGEDSHWRIQAAFAHDWSGDTRAGLQGALTF